MSFANKVVVVTGGSSGIGAATAILFAKEGADVVIVGRNETRLNNVAAECAKVGKKPLVIKADVSKEDEARSIISKTIDAYGKLHVLINNAGILRHVGLLEDDFVQTYDEIMNTNIRSVVIITKEAAPHLIKTKGNIVNISSVLGVTLLKTSAYMAYCISKAGLNHFTRSAALELGPRGVRINTVSPGSTRTDILENAGVAWSWDDLSSTTVLNKVAESAEIADLILFVASDRAKSITGSNYLIENGEILK